MGALGYSAGGGIFVDLYVHFVDKSLNVTLLSLDLYEFKVRITTSQNIYLNVQNKVHNFKFVQDLKVK